MIHVVTAENRVLFRREMIEMHRHRKRVFVDQMKWRLDCEGDLEIDAFDTEAALYLLYFDVRGVLQASARMLATDRPHLLDTLFSHLCPQGAPKAPDIWEATRFCPAPEIEDAGQKRRLLGLIIAGILEAGLLFGVSKVSFVASATLRPLALRAGWSARALGPSALCEGDRVTACIADIDPAGLKRVREKYALTTPVLRYTPARNAA